MCHSRGEYAHDDDGDGFHEVHVNTAKGVWSLLRSWLRPHRGISQEKRPLYVGFFQLVHNVRIPGAKVCSDLSWNCWWRNQGNCPESRTLKITISND